MPKFQWSLDVGTEKRANPVRSDSRLMTNRRFTHLTLYLHLVKLKSWITGKPHLTLVSVGCCSRARVCLDRRLETQIFVDPAAFLVTDVLNRVAPPIKPDQNLATRGEEHGILLVLI
jgi:hypothetical protein